MWCVFRYELSTTCRATCRTTCRATVRTTWMLHGTARQGYEYYIDFRWSAALGHSPQSSNVAESSVNVFRGNADAISKFVASFGLKERREKYTMSKTSTSNTSAKTKHGWSMFVSVTQARNIHNYDKQNDYAHMSLSALYSAVPIERVVTKSTPLRQ